MRVDCHLHIGPKPGESLSQRAASLCGLLKQYNLDAAVVLPLQGLFSNCADHRADNDFVFEFCQQQPGRLIPAFTVNPWSGAEALDEIRRCHAEHGSTLLKLHPWLQGFSIATDEMNAVAALCQEMGVAIVLHDGTPPYSAPLQLARLCRDFPKLRVVSGHAGLNDLWYDALLGALRYRNFFLCLCGLAAYPIQRILAEVPADQICVGSDWINGSEDVFWYRWNLWRRLPVPANIREVIENETPERILGPLSLPS
jgi:predicted TIM-barrel fold metal-dependent hydrolase